MLYGINFLYPDNFHVHFRELNTTENGPGRMPLVARVTAKIFRRALVMPNIPAITTAGELTKYQEEINSVKGDDLFTPLMSLKLTHQTTPEDIDRAAKAGMIAAKIYPEGVTTGSHGGIRFLDEISPVLAAMQDLNLVLCVHGEEPGSPVLDREKNYLPKINGLTKTFPRLRIVLEHISTDDAVEMVRKGPSTLAATITPVHLVATIDWILGDGLKPHNFMYPIPKHLKDKKALIAAATSGNPKFFAGTDSAPHYIQQKESVCGCAGIFSEPVAMSIYAEVFEGTSRNAWDGKWVEVLEKFTSHFGADFYGLPRNTGDLGMIREPWKVPERFVVDLNCPYKAIVPFMSGETLSWQVPSFMKCLSSGVDFLGEYSFLP